MKQSLAHVSLLVKEYDEAIEFYTKKLMFELVEDTLISENKRWVLVRPGGAVESCVLLARASDDHQRSIIGNQTGGRVFLFLATDDFERDYANLLRNNVKIVREPKNESYGQVLVFEDLYGNKWDLVQHNYPGK